MPTIMAARIAPRGRSGGIRTPEQPMTQKAFGICLWQNSSANGPSELR